MIAIRRSAAWTALCLGAALAPLTPAAAAGGSSGTPHYADTTSAQTTVGLEVNSLTLYLDPAKPAEAKSYASVHMGTQTGDLSGTMSLVACDVDGVCGPPTTTRWTAKLSSQSPYQIPANWFPGVKTSTGRPLGSATLYVSIDSAYVVDTQPAPVINSLR